jgi:hypothetical protein
MMDRSVDAESHHLLLYRSWKKSVNVCHDPDHSTKRTNPFNMDALKV